MPVISHPIIRLGIVALLVGDVTAQVQDPPSTRERVQEAATLISRGKLSQAEEVLELAVEERPQASDAWVQLGAVRQAQNKYNLALKAYAKATQFPSTKPFALYNSACIHAIQNDTELAIATLQAARKAGYADRGPFLADPNLQSLRKDERFNGLIPPLLTGQDLFAEPVEVLLALEGENPNDEFGWIARKAGDIDGDGVLDFVTTAPGYKNNAGKAYVFSGKTGKELFTREGPAGARYGNSAAPAGDVNGDGTPDILVGGPATDVGIAEVLSGKDGSVIHLFKGTQAGGRFGYKVCGIGDLNGDGCDDVAVTALAVDGKKPNSGKCLAYSGKDGKLLFTLDGDTTGDKFGSSVIANAGAKSPLLLIGAQDAGELQRGRVYAYSLSAENPKLRFTIDADRHGQNLGMMFLSFPGDLNSDGIPDVYVSDFGDSKGGSGAGRVFVCSGRDGKTILEITGKSPGEGFGTSPSDAGDANGDGVGDLIIGAWQNREQAPSGGKVYLYSGATGKQLATWTCKQHGDTFGFDATGIGDVNRDGRVDFLLTSAWSPVHGPKTGRVFILAGPKLPE